MSNNEKSISELVSDAFGKNKFEDFYRIKNTNINKIYKKLGNIPKDKLHANIIAIQFKNDIIIRA